MDREWIQNYKKKIVTSLTVEGTEHGIIDSKRLRSSDGEVVAPATARAAYQSAHGCQDHL